MRTWLQVRENKIFIFQLGIINQLLIDHHCISCAPSTHSHPSTTMQCHHPDTAVYWSMVFPFLSTGGGTCTWYLQAKQFWGSWRLADRHPTGILNHWYFLMQRWCRFIIYLSFIYLFIVFICGGWGYKNYICSNKIYTMLKSFKGPI